MQGVPHLRGCHYHGHGYFQNFECTIDESIKGAASLRRYGITFDGNINIKYKTSPLYAVLPINEERK